MRITASELKYQHEMLNPESYMFTRKAMQFFGDTMHNYYVPVATVQIKRSCGEIVECYELQRRRSVKNGLSGSTFFSVDTFKRILGELV